MQINKHHSSLFLHLTSTFILALPNICLAFTEPVPLVYRLVNVLLPISCYAAALTLWRKPGQMLWILFPLVFLSAFQMVLLYLYGHSVIAVDMFLNLLTTNTGEATELLDNLLPAIIFVAVIYVPTLIWAGISAWKGSPLTPCFVRIVRKTAATTGLVALFCLFFLTGKAYRVTNDLYPINVFQNIRLAAQRTYATGRYAETSRHFRFHARSTHPSDEREIYLLVIGETARAANFQLYGYPRKTNPGLSTTKNLVVFNKALTQSNTTHKSVPMLLSAVSAVDFDSIYTQKSIITAFKEAGFHTVFLSNQLPNHSFIDFFGKEADEWRFIKETQKASDRVGEGGYDGALLPLVDSVLQKNRCKQLIVLHTYGSHFEYHKRYPQQAVRFLPDAAAEAKAVNRPSLLNAYDNSILYTDKLLTALISRLKATNTMAALLYISDHGENIFDDNRRIFLHASPIPSCFELHVPLMVWLSNRYQTLNPTTKTTLTAHRNKVVATSLSVFHTFTHIAGLRFPRLQPAYSLASPTYQSAPSLYLNDHNEAVSLQQIVTAPQDRTYLHHIGVELK